ncbi:hypothetical protein UCRPC4_g00849 [Phaeomoniella chlamydospora]|uniref:Uncharacterized protein n=1 Tax=Phaeomoniella chlamydospora TaxID=158046 RepID=A0A0G2EZZ5_PHACM|nr:hypothetical protein UCRPC4_g00849 [Phaeomoniella chlamydospora]
MHIGTSNILFSQGLSGVRKEFNATHAAENMEILWSAVRCFNKLLLCSADWKPEQTQLLRDAGTGTDDADNGEGGSNTTSHIREGPDRINSTERAPEVNGGSSPEVDNWERTNGHTSELPSITAPQGSPKVPFDDIQFTQQHCIRGESWQRPLFVDELDKGSIISRDIPSLSSNGELKPLTMTSDAEDSSFQKRPSSFPISKAPHTLPSIKIRKMRTRLNVDPAISLPRPLQGLGIDGLDTASNFIWKQAASSRTKTHTGDY